MVYRYLTETFGGKRAGGHAVNRDGRRMQNLAGPAGNAMNRMQEVQNMFGARAPSRQGNMEFRGLPPGVAPANPFNDMMKNGKKRQPMGNPNRR